MDDGAAHDEISQLEIEIHELAEAGERCRKIAWASQLVIIGGFVLLGALILRVIWPDGLAVVGALVAIIGGIVVYGSNAGTARQTAEALRKAEALRAEMIGNIELRLVTERPTVH